MNILKICIMKFNEGLGKLKALNFKTGNWVMAVGVLLFTVNASYGDNGGLSIGKDTTICAGKCLTLTSNIAGICKWSTGETTSSIKVCPTADETIVLTVNTGQLTISDSIHIKVDQHPVYPGDADNNAQVNKNDVFRIGLAYGATGASRSISGNTWDAVHAADWSKSFKSGLNYKYADCNGDGKIDKYDLEAINANYSSTHNKTEETMVDGNPDLYYVPNKDTVVDGDTLVLHIMLGTETSPVNNIYGVSFTHMFDPGTVKSGSMMLVVDPTNSWFYQDGGAVVSFLHPNYDIPSGDIAISKSDGLNVSGYGQVGDLSVVVQDNIGAKQGPIGSINLISSDVTAISNDESSVPLSVKATKIYWKDVVSKIVPTIIQDAQVQVYPNPISEKTLTIHFSGGLRADRIDITDLLGNTVLTAVKPAGEQTNLELPDLKQGMYLLRVSTSNGVIMKKLIINNH
jgi:hypothetical protein